MPKRTAFVRVTRGKSQSSVTYDVTDAPNESIADLVSIGLSSFEHTHGEEALEGNAPISVTAEFWEDE